MIRGLVSFIVVLVSYSYSIAETKYQVCSDSKLIQNSKNESSIKSNIIIEEEDSLVARRAHLFIKGEEGFVVGLIHNFQTRETQIECLTPYKGDKKLSYNFHIPVLVERGKGESSYQVTLWQLNILATQEKVGYWLQPSQVLSEKRGEAVFLLGNRESKINEPLTLSFRTENKKSIGVFQVDFDK